MAISKSPTIKHEKGSSSRSHKDVGSGSRPGGASKHKIMTSAPSDPHGLGRKPAGALK